MLSLLVLFGCEAVTTTTTIIIIIIITTTTTTTEVHGILISES